MLYFSHSLMSPCLSQAAKRFEQKSEVNDEVKENMQKVIKALKEIGKIFDMDYTAVSQATRRFEDKIRKDNKKRIMVNSVLELLKDKEMSNVKT